LAASALAASPLAASDAAAFCPDRRWPGGAFEAVQLGVDRWPQGDMIDLRLDDGSQVMMRLADVLPAGPGRPGARVQASFEVQQRWAPTAGGFGVICQVDDVVVDVRVIGDQPVRPSGWRDVCPAKTLDQGFLEGLYLGAGVCDSDTCQTSFRLEDGIEVHLHSSPGQAWKLFGPPGRLVRAEYELRNRWLKEPMCWHPRRLTGGRPLR
jgi:hypothetical protein